MSLGYNRYRCNDCGSEINVQWGMVGLNWMGPSNEQVICPNPSCNAVGHKSFTNIRQSDFSNAEDRVELIRNNHMDNA